MNEKKKKTMHKKAFRAPLSSFTQSLRLSNYHLSHQKITSIKLQKHMNKLLLFIHKTTNLLFSFEAFYFRYFFNCSVDPFQSKELVSNDLSFFSH